MPTSIEIPNFQKFELYRNCYLIPSVMPSESRSRNAGTLSKSYKSFFYNKQINRVALETAIYSDKVVYRLDHPNAITLVHMCRSDSLSCYSFKDLKIRCITKSEKKVLSLSAFNMQVSGCLLLDKDVTNSLQTSARNIIFESFLDSDGKLLKDISTCHPNFNTEDLAKNGFFISYRYRYRSNYIGCINRECSFEKPYSNGETIDIDDLKKDHSEQYKECKGVKIDDEFEILNLNSIAPAVVQNSDYPIVDTSTKYTEKDYQIFHVFSQGGQCRYMYAIIRKDLVKKYSMNDTEFQNFCSDLFSKNLWGRNHVKIIVAPIIHYNKKHGKSLFGEQFVQKMISEVDNVEEMMKQLYFKSNVQLCVEKFNEYKSNFLSFLGKINSKIDPNNLDFIKNIFHIDLESSLKELCYITSRIELLKTYGVLINYDKATKQHDKLCFINDSIFTEKYFSIKSELLKSLNTNEKHFKPEILQLLKDNLNENTNDISEQCNIIIKLQMLLNNINMLEQKIDDKPFDDIKLQHDYEQMHLKIKREYKEELEREVKQYLDKNISQDDTKLCEHLSSLYDEYDAFVYKKISNDINGFRNKEVNTEKKNIQTLYDIMESALFGSIPLSLKYSYPENSFTIEEMKDITMFCQQATEFQALLTEVLTEEL